jgi:hypothetical protein
MEWVITAVPALLVGGLLLLAAGLSFRLWRSAMRDEPLLLHLVLARKGLSLAAGADPGVLVQTGAAVRRCMLCADRTTCRRWLEGEVGGPLERFCPNAELMARLQACAG